MTVFSLAYILVGLSIALANLIGMRVFYGERNLGHDAPTALLVSCFLIVLWPIYVLFVGTRETRELHND